MQSSQSNRRGFIGKLAILSAGALVMSGANCIQAGSSNGDLQAQWKRFWKENEGKPYHKKIQLEHTTGIIPCKGHDHRRGEVIYFSNDNLLAQPTWVYWGENNKGPADVFITFLDATYLNRIGTLNRFELQAFFLLSADTNATTSLPLLSETRQRAPLHEFASKRIRIKTSISQGQNIRILNSFTNKEIAIETKLMYNI